MRTLLLVFSAVMLALGGLIAPLNAQEPLEKTGELPPLYRAEMALAESYAGDANLVHLATNMHVGVGHAFFMIGILLLASRKADIAVAKTILIAYLIGIAAMFVVMNMVLGQSELMNFSIEMIAPDMVFFLLAIYGYFKAK